MTTPAMQFGLFANFENPAQNAWSPARALAESVENVRHAETLGYSEAWITEHHFNPFSVSAAIFPLLAHLAGVTSSIRLGSAAVLLPMHNLVQVAEEAATVDSLSNGRLLLGVAKGGPFPAQFHNFHVPQEESRARTLEALPLLERLLTETGVSHQSGGWNLDQVTIYPRPTQQAIPLWLASVSEESITLAAQRGYGLMGPAPAPLEKLRGILAQYRQALATAGTEPRPYVLSRFFFCHPDRQTAIREAVPFVKDFARNMGAVLKQAQAAGGPGAPTPFGVGADALLEERILANSIIGDMAECQDRVQALVEALGPHHLILKPASADPEANRRALTLFAEKVRPQFSV